jgi:hypothetical protein
MFNLICKRLFFFGLLNCICCFAQTIESLKGQADKAYVNQPFTFNISLTKSSAQLVGCGLLFDYGNGEKTKIRIGDNGDSDLNLARTISYPNPGVYNASVEGVFVIRGLFTAAGCAGSVKKFSVTVIDPKAEKELEDKLTSKSKSTNATITASPPSSLKPPIDREVFIARLKTDTDFKQMIEGFTSRKLDSIPLLMIEANKGDPQAQFFYALAHIQDWTNINDPKMACYWFRQSAELGLSESRYYLAERAFNKPECFDIKPSLEEAKIWAQLAKQSKDNNITTKADILLQDILKAQIEGRK